MACKVRVYLVQEYLCIGQSGATIAPNPLPLLRFEAKRSIFDAVERHKVIARLAVVVSASLVSRLCDVLTFNLDESDMRG